MQYCPVCGTQLADHAKFCASCGNALVSESAPQAAQKKGLNPLLILIPIVAIVLALAVIFLNPGEKGGKALSFHGLSITVPESMEDITGSDPALSAYTFVLQNDEMAIYGLRESMALFDKDYSLREYTQLVLDANNINATFYGPNDSGYCHFTYTAETTLGVDANYHTATFKGPDAYWMIQIVRYKADSELQSSILRSIRFD